MRFPSPSRCFLWFLPLLSSPIVYSSASQSRDDKTIITASTATTSSRKLPVAGISDTDDAGYTMCSEGRSALGYQWIDITQTGTKKEQFSSPVQLDFDFNFYGTTYNPIYLHRYGYLFFDGGYRGGFSHCGLPTADVYRHEMPAEFIGPFNMDINPVCGPWYLNPNGCDPWGQCYTCDIVGAIYYQAFDPCPIGSGQCAVFQYHDFYRGTHSIDADPQGNRQYTEHLDFEAVLFENGDMHFQYNTTANFTSPYGGSCNGEPENHVVVGIQGSTASSPSWALQYTCTAEDLFPGLAISYEAPSNVGTACVGGPFPTSEPTSSPVPSSGPTPVPTASSRPTMVASSSPTSAECVGRGVDNACIFNEDTDEGFTAVCLQTTDEETGYSKFRNACRKNPDLEGLVPGDMIEEGSEWILFGCGCCDKCGISDETIFALQGSQAKYCRRPAICTPEDDEWEVCSAWGNGIVRQIKVCINHEDGTEEETCVDPFYIPPLASDEVACGPCESST